MGNPNFVNKSTQRSGMFADVIAEMDYRVGQVLDAVKEAGIEDNTVFILSSDNAGGGTIPQTGPGSNGPWRGDFFNTPFEGSMRVPAIVRWPGKVQGGVVTEQMLAAVDWLPTLAGIAGVSNLVPKDRPIEGVDAFHTGIVKHAYDAIYYCANAYTTLGMGSLDIDTNWRNISPIIAISGLFTFAWTTSALVDVVSSNGRLLEQLEDEREREMEMRFALRKEEWDVLKTERSEALSERDKTRTQFSGLSFFQRRKIWREERNGEEEFRSTARAQIKDLRQKERQDEGKLGPETPTDAKDKVPH
jgi:hypothetical protein